MSGERLDASSVVEILARGERVQVSLVAALQWHDARLSDDGTQIVSVNGPIRLADMTRYAWRREPMPRVHDLPAKWLHVVGGGRFAGELFAALAEDELVSLKGVTAESLCESLRILHEAHQRTVASALCYLRSKVVKP